MNLILTLSKETHSDTLNAEVGYTCMSVPLGKLITLQISFFFLNTCHLTGNLSYSEKISVRTFHAALNILQDYIFQLCYVSHSSQNPQEKYYLNIVCGSFSSIHI